MKPFKTLVLSGLVAAGLMAAGLAGPAAAKDQLLLLSVSSGSPHNVFHTRLATLAEKYTDYELQISLGVSPPKGIIDLAKGNADFAFSAPSITDFMARRAAMYKKVEDAPEMYKKLRTVLNYDGGLYVFVTHADSGIKSLADIKGKTVSLSIPGDAANLVLIQMVKAETGYEPGKDYTMSPLHGAAAVQAFQDGHLDMWAAPGAQRGRSVGRRMGFREDPQVGRQR